MIELNAEPAFDWDEIGQWEGPAHELDYDMVWSDEGRSSVYSFMLYVCLFCGFPIVSSRIV